MSASTLQTAGQARPLSAGRLLQGGLLGGLLAAGGNLLVLFGARALLNSELAIPMQGGPVEPLPAAAVAISSFFPALLAALLLGLLARYVRRPLRAFSIISGAVLLLSFAGPLTLPVALDTRLVLALMHVVAAAAIVGTLGRLGARG